MQYFCSCHICKINPGKTESSSESISSYIVARKRKFDDELDKSDINSVNSLSDNKSDNDNQSLDEDYNDNNPSQYYNGKDNPSLDNNENDKVEDIKTESDISDENDELTEMDNKFKDIENINDDELIQGLCLLHTKVLHSISDIAFNKILDNINSNLTIYKLKKKINDIIPFKPQKYVTCKNSCIAFTSLYESLTTCPICNENRFDNNRENEENEKIYTDIFDEMLYQDLLQRDYFKNGRDITLSGSCNGYQIFEQKTDDCWIVLLINNNLPPYILKELQEFEEGVPCTDGRTNGQFILCVHLLTWMEDIPALSKNLNLTRHNLYKACRFYMIERICYPLNHHIYYLLSDIVYNIRNHDDTVNMAKLIDNETIKIQKII
ncbi:transposase domain-containing protein [Rhizophagus clarus]|uniref:Transposase domain-containing protein n=1 Tax=Rhizophagus clarus TaxID=94130 RepID=A0A8H3LNL0_9GLOM|nr:transposase domain-containing protein [Rhizophagus clarus]